MDLVLKFLHDLLVDDERSSRVFDFTNVDGLVLPVNQEVDLRTVRVFSGRTP